MKTQPKLATQPTSTGAWTGLGLFVGMALLPLGAAAIQTCDVDGVHVNPSHGGTTAGKTGLMRCREADTGVLVREQALREGKFMGVVRHYKAGVLEREHHVNEKGNRDGLAREFAATPGTSNPVLREASYRNGSTVGRVRVWYPGGTLKRVALHGDDGREQASAEFTAQGKLTDLRCGSTALLAPDADDSNACGHAGQPGTAELFSHQGALQARLIYERGERRRKESFWSNGKTSSIEEADATGSSERRFAEDGALRRETQWTGSGRERRISAEREHHESGKLIREKRYQPSERGSTLQSEQQWYLNGQPREKSEYTPEATTTLRRDTAWHDNGKLAFEGQWKLEGRYASQAIGVHKSYDSDGRLRAESHHDARGKLVRERSLDETGKLLKDDEVFEDGSRKSTAR